MVVDGDHVVVGAPSDRRDGWVRSYLEDGRLVQWRPPREAFPAIIRWAVDAEIASQAVPSALAARTGISAPEIFWPRWTAVEVACKLLDVPMVMWIVDFGLDPLPAMGRGVRLRTTTHLSLTITVGGLTPDGG